MTYQSNIQFAFTGWDGETEYTSVNHAVSGEKAEYLPAIIGEFVKFLQHMGFTYVTGEVLSTSYGHVITTDSSEPLPEVVLEATEEQFEEIIDYLATYDVPEEAEFAVGDGGELTEIEA